MVQPRCSNAHPNSHAITGHTGPRQYSRGRNPGSFGETDGGMAANSAG